MGLFTVYISQKVYLHKCADSPEISRPVQRNSGLIWVFWDLTKEKHKLDSVRHQGLIYSPNITKSLLLMFKFIYRVVKNLLPRRAKWHTETFSETEKKNETEKSHSVRHQALFIVNISQKLYSEVYRAVRNLSPSLAKFQIDIFLRHSKKLAQ